MAPNFIFHVFHQNTSKLHRYGEISPTGVALTRLYVVKRRHRTHLSHERISGHLQNWSYLYV